MDLVVGEETEQIGSDLNFTNKQEYFRDKNIVLYHGDVLDQDLFKKQFIDLIVTSPPYNVGIDYNSNDDELSYHQYLEFSERWMSNCYKWSNTQARFLLNIPLDKNKGGNRSVGSDLTKISQDIGWKYHSTIIWNEGNISRRTAWGSWMKASAPFVIAPVELIVILYKDEWKKLMDQKYQILQEMSLWNIPMGYGHLMVKVKRRLATLPRFRRSYLIEL